MSAKDPVKFLVLPISSPPTSAYQKTNHSLIDTLRALYLGDNDFELLPGDVMNLRNLQVFCFVINLT